MKFFEELKKRNVYKTATAYAVTSWLILQIVDVVGPGLGWDDSVTTLLLKILIVGFPIALVLAWLYELTPKGFRRTGTYQKETLENKKAGQKLNYFIIGILAIALCFILAERIFFAEAKINFDTSEASIAVLPFKNDSPDEKNMYFCDGITEGVRENLSRIPTFSVISRTSVEQFRENPPSVAVIAKELGVNYILEGSVLRLENRSVIRARLIYAPEERNLWSEEFDRELGDVFSVLAEVTKNIAEELETTISPEVRQNIEFEPTDDLTAYDFYLQGQEYFNSYQLTGHKKDLQIAERLFKTSMSRDASYAQAYVGLSQVFRQLHQYEFFNDNSLVDSMLVLCHKAISLNPNSADAYWVRGAFYDDFMYDIPKATADLNRALELNPNHTQAMMQLAWVTAFHQSEPVTALRLWKDLEKLDRSANGLTETYRTLAMLYWDIGVKDKAYYYVDKAIKINPREIGMKIWFYVLEGRISEAISILKKGEDWQGKLAALGFFHLLLKDYKAAFIYYKKWEEEAKQAGEKQLSELRDWHRYGQVLMALGRKEEGIKMMEYQLDLNKKLETNFMHAHTIFYENAGIYASLGNVSEAINYLQEFDRSNRWDDGKLDLIQMDPLFDNIRDNEAFKAIITRRLEELKQVREEITRLEAAGEL